MAQNASVNKIKIHVIENFLFKYTNYIQGCVKEFSGQSKYKLSRIRNCAYYFIIFITQIYTFGSLVALPPSPETASFFS